VIAIPGSRFGIRVVILVSPIDIFYAQDPYERYIRTVESDSDCQNTNFRRQQEVVL